MAEVITDSNMRSFVHSLVSNTFGLTVDQVAEKCKGNGRFYSWLGSDVAKIKNVLSKVEANGVSPAFFAAYEKTEGYNSKWGWLNHTKISGDPLTDADNVSKWIVEQSKNTTDRPAWIDYANYKDFVPLATKQAGNADFEGMPAGSIGKVVIAGTAAATWEVYYPNGLKAEYNGVQNYGTPINHMMGYIVAWGGVIDGTSTTPPSVPPEPPPEQTPDDPNTGIDTGGFIEALNADINKMLTVDLFKMGRSETYNNSYLQLVKQMDNTYKVKPNLQFFDAIKKKFEDFNGEYIPPPDPVDPPDPTDPTDPPDPVEPVPSTEKKFPVKITNGINFFKRSAWGVGTLQRNMTYGMRSTGVAHYGYDIGGGGVKHTIHSVTAGKVVRANFANGIGNRLTIENSSDKYFLEYGHLDSFIAKVGDVVSPGDPIAKMGQTGGNYAIHLDLKIATSLNGFYSWDTTIDPEKYLGVTGNNTTTLQQP